MKRAISQLVWLLMLLTTNVLADQGQTVIVMSLRSPAYEQVAQLLTENMQSYQRRVETVTLEKWSAEALGGAENYIAIGGQATQSVLERAPGKLLLSVMITRSAYQVMQARHGHFSAIYVDQSPQRVMALAKVLLPEKKNIGLLAGNKENSVEPSYQQAAIQLGIRAESAFIAREDVAATAINQLLEDSEGIVALPDALVMQSNTAKWLLYMAYQQNVPVIGFSQAYVKAGALAAVYSSPDDLSRQANEWLTGYFQKNIPMRGRGSYPKYYDVAINRWVAKSMLLDVPDSDEILRRIDQQSPRGQQ
ncbi:MAG: hypothetical protein OEW58_00790 [Gammaproteobacteria bacterium]|nr:hypothetical protein [Gammaproteobacteria bacterium]